MSSTLFIGRLKYEVSSHQLEQHFIKYGQIVRCEVKTDYGFVEFSDEKNAQEARDNLHGTTLCGNSIVVEIAKAKKGSQNSSQRSAPPARPRGRSRSPYSSSSRRRSRSPRHRERSVSSSYSSSDSETCKM